LVDRVSARLKPSFSIDLEADPAVRAIVISELRIMNQQNG
jgi:hypothetical protein